MTIRKNILAGIFVGLTATGLAVSSIAVAADESEGKTSGHCDSHGQKDGMHAGGMMGGHGMGAMMEGGDMGGMMGGHGMGSMMEGGDMGGMMGGHGMDSMMDGGAMGGMMSLLHGLDLTEEQHGKVRAIMRELRNKNILLTAKRMDIADDLTDAYAGADKLDTVKIVDLYGKIFDVRKQIIQNELETKNKIADVLTPEQKTKFKDNYKSHGHMMSKGHHAMP